MMITSILVILGLVLTNSKCATGIFQNSFEEDACTPGSGYKTYFPLDFCIQSEGDGMYTQPAYLIYHKEGKKLTIKRYDQQDADCETLTNTTIIKLGECVQNEWREHYMFEFGTLKDKMAPKNGEYLEYYFRGQTCQESTLEKVILSGESGCRNTCREAVCESTKSYCDREKDVVYDDVFKDKDCLEENLWMQGVYNGTCVNESYETTMTACDILF